MRKPIIPRSFTALAVVGLLAGVAACSGGIGSYVPSGGERSPESGRALPGPSTTPTPMPGAATPTPQPHSHGILSGRALPGPSTTPTPMPGAATPTPQPHVRGILSGRALPGQPTPTPTPTQAPIVASVLCTAGVGANCHVLQNTALSPLLDALGVVIPGYHPSDLRAAYGLSPLPLLGGLLGGSTVPTGPTIAIVDAYDDPNAEHDLGIYRNRMGLAACTTANGCFKKLNANLQSGSYPAFNKGWSAEISLDLAMASAACPTCRIALVEAADDNIDSLGAVVDKLTAAGSPVVPAAISNSYGIFETSTTSASAAHFSHPGVPIVASAGDTPVVEFPATLSNVVAVGGSTLVRNILTSRGWSEVPWNSTATGCSTYFPAGAWQHSRCSTRGVADVSFVADLAPGIAVYDTAAGGWVVYGGTSAGAPFIAGLFAAAHDYPSNGIGAAPVYAKASYLNSLGTSTTNITLGSPKGLGAF